MKTRISKIAPFLFISLLLNISCGSNKDEQVEELMTHLVECAQIFEQCEGGCEPTEAELSELARCQLQCFSNDDPSVWCLTEFCYERVWGENTPDECKRKCKEAYYECVFGPEWEDLNLKAIK